MQLFTISAGQITSSVWANATRTLTDYGIPTVSENTGGFVSMTAGNGVKGAYAQLIAATAAQAKRLTVQLSGGTAVVYNVDISIGGAGSEVVLIGNISYNVASAVGVSDTSFAFDILIAAGTRVAARAQASAGTPALSISVQFFE